MEKIATYKQKFLRSGLCASLLMLLPLMSSCISENGDCPPDPSNQDISVSLQIEGSLPAATRADFTEEEGTLAESYIDINDLYVLAFEIGEGKTVADGKSVLKDIIWSPNAAERLEESVISSNGTQVLLRTFLSSENYNTADAFSIVTIANTKNWGGSITLSKGVTKLADLQQTLTYTTLNGSNSWAPDNANSSGIPLFGIRKVSLAGYDNKYNNSANPYNLGIIWMLRSLAKVEISVDPAVNLIPETALEIESASVIARGWNSNLQLIPFQSTSGNLNLNRMQGYDTSGNTGQVNLAPDFSSSFTPTSSGSVLQMTKATRTVNGQQIPIFVAYLPEYTLTGSENGSPRNNIIRVRFKNIAQEFPLAIAPYANGLPTDVAEVHWQYLLRNYLYRFQISGIQVDEQLTLNWTVCPMDEETITIPPFD